jgi:hypothetical protein
MVVGIPSIPAPLQGGNQGAPPQGANPYNVFMCECGIDVYTWDHNDDFHVIGDK